ncbi:acyltransferase [Mucilaginibacter sp.]
MLTEKIIRKLKGDPSYKFNDDYSDKEIFIVLIGRFWQLIRGFYKRVFFKQTNGLVFIGRSVSIKHAYRIKAGKNLILEDYVNINALSSDGINLGDNVTLARGCNLICTGVIAHKGIGISIGNNTGINAGAYIAGQGGVEIGNNVIIGPRVKIFSENHLFNDIDVNIKDQSVCRSKVTIASNCWIGGGVTILAGVNIGEGCVIAAGCVVTKTIEPYSVVAGIPGKVIKSRMPEDDKVINLKHAIAGL